LYSVGNGKDEEEEAKDGSCDVGASAGACVVLVVERR